MTKKIRIALIGLGRVGETFAEHFLASIQIRHIAAEIVAVAAHNIDSPVAMGFAHSKVPVYSDGLKIAELGDAVDIIFDLTGSLQFRQQLRDRLRELDNHHTVIAPEVMARLLWSFFSDDAQLPDVHGNTGY